MDVLVLLEERPERSTTTPPEGGDGQPSARWGAAAAGSAGVPPRAHVNSAPAAAAHEGTVRDVVTLYGSADPESLALALAAAVEGERTVPPGAGRASVMRHLGVFDGLGAVGDLAWRDQGTGQLLTQDVEIPADALRRTADRLLGECGALIRRTAAGLAMPDWPEGARRAIHLSFPELVAPGALAGAGQDALLASLREADGNAFEGD